MSSFPFPFPQQTPQQTQQPAPAQPPPAGYAPPMNPQQPPAPSGFAAYSAQPPPPASQVPSSVAQAQAAGFATPVASSPAALPAYGGYAIPPGYPQQQAAPAGGANPVLNALKNAKIFGRGTQFPRINATYLVEVGAVKMTGTQGTRYGCIEAKIVESRGEAGVLPAGGDVSILENISDAKTGGAGRFMDALQKIAGEDWTKVPPSELRLAHFVEDDSRPVQGFQNLALGLRLVITTSPAWSQGRNNGGVKKEITGKAYSTVPKTVEEMQRIDALRSAANAGLGPLAQVWNVGL